MSKIQIQSSRTSLTLLSKEDYADVLEMFGDEDTFRYIPHLLDKKKEEYLAYLDNKLHRIENGGHDYWVARLPNQDLVGVMVLTILPWDDKKIQIGWQIRTKFWKQGFGSELALAIRDFALNELKLTEIYGVFDPENIASKRILEKLDFSYLEEKEGTLIYLYTKKK